LEDTFKDNGWVSPFFAPHTFEVDFIAAGNARKVVGILPDVYKDAPTIATAKAELESADIALFGQRALTMADNYGKGWFAILLGKKIDPQTAIPKYILDAIAFAHPVVTKEVWFNVLSYRVNYIDAEDIFTASAVFDDFRAKLLAFRNGDIDFVGIRNEMLATFPDDRINDVLAVF